MLVLWKEGYGVGLRAVDDGCGGATAVDVVGDLVGEGEREGLRLRKCRLAVFRARRQSRLRMSFSRCVSLGSLSLMRLRRCEVLV